VGWIDFWEGCMWHIYRYSRAHPRLFFRYPLPHHPGSLAGAYMNHNTSPQPGILLIAPPAPAQPAECLCVVEYVWLSLVVRQCVQQALQLMPFLPVKRNQIFILLRSCLFDRFDPSFITAAKHNPDVGGFILFAWWG
jgi:hypothetical protein